MDDGGRASLSAMVFMSLASASLLWRRRFRFPRLCLGARRRNPFGARSCRAAWCSRSRHRGGVLRGLGVTVSTAFIEPSVHVVTAAGLSMVLAPTKVALRLARACEHASEVFDVIASHGNSFHPATGKPCARAAQCRLSAAAGSASAKPSRRRLIQKPPAWGLVHGQQVGVAQLRVLPQLEQHGAQGRRLARGWRPQRAYPLQGPTRARVAAPVQARDAAEVRYGMRANRSSSVWSQATSEVCDSFWPL